MPPSTSFDSEPPIGRILGGRYALGSPLGRGGWSWVMAGRDLSLKRDVAVKLLKPELAAHEDLLKRFRTEAVAMARIRHPHIVSIFDHGIDADGRPYLVIERVDGGSLRDMLQRSGKLSLDEAVPVAMAVLDGLAAAHDAGVIHRDLKPGNVLIGLDGTPKITDFGVARLDDEDHTRTGEHLGTVKYMAPEQLLDPRGVDGRADVYAVGALLYVLLTAENPYALYAEPFESERFDAVPRRLRRVVFRSTRRKPDQRYQSAREMEIALGEAWRVEPPPPVARPFGIVAASVVAVVAVAIALVSVWTPTMAIPLAAADAIARTAVDDSRPAEPETPAEPVTATPVEAPTPPAGTAATAAPAERRAAPVAAARSAPVPSGALEAPTVWVGPPGNIMVNTIPPSRVSIDGREVGRTRWSGEVASGERTLSFVGDDGVRSSTVVQVPEGGEVRVCWDLATNEACPRR